MAMILLIRRILFPPGPKTNGVTGGGGAEPPEGYVPTYHIYGF